MHPPFSIRESIRFGWAKTREHNAFVFKVVLALIALQLLNALQNKVLEHSPLGGIASVLMFVIDAFLTTGGLVITLKLARGAEARFHDLVPPARLVWRCLVAGICAAILMILPLLVAAAFYVLVLVSLGISHVGWIPASQFVHWLPLFGLLAGVAVAAIGYMLSLAAGLSMVRFAVIDGAHIVESLEKSARMTKGVRLKLLLFMLVVVGLNILGAIVVLVGLLISIPVTSIAFAYVYTALNGRIEAVQEK